MFNKKDVPINEQILNTISMAYPFSYRSIEQCYDILRSFDKLVECCEYALLHNVSLSTALNYELHFKRAIELSKQHFDFNLSEAITTGFTTNVEGRKLLYRIRNSILDASKADTSQRAAKLTAFSIIGMLDGSGEWDGPDYEIRIKDTGELVKFFHHDL